MNKRKSEVIFVHQNLISNWLTYLVHAKSTGELISFGFSDRSVRSLVSAKRSANRWDQTKKTTSLFDVSLVSVRIKDSASEMSSRLQLDVRNLSLGMRHLVNAYEVKAGTV